MTDVVLTIRADSPIGTISPRLYGHFAEHLGRCCYGGLWAGTDYPDNQDGFRRDVVAALKALPVPLLRWPGGCYADHYHWQDGIGPKDQRPTRIGMSCGLQVEDDNSLGTHEFLRLCELLGAEPYLAGNVGSGSPQELCDWLEYCTTAIDTTWVRQRVANGHAKPFNVPLWGVGNENWGCGGNYDATTYAHEYRRYATMLRHVNPNAELVICGQEDAWNNELLEAIGKHSDLIDHLSIHRYWINGGPETTFTEQEYYNLLAEAEATEAFVQQTSAILKDKAGEAHGIGIALDEWGVWHPEARTWGPGDVTRRDPVTYEQAGTLRDALAVGVALEGFHRQCNVLSLANIAQIVNVLQAVVMTEGSRMWLTPTYHALRLHAPHIGAKALPVEIDHAQSLADGSSAVSATASTSGSGIAVTLINRHYSQPASVRFSGPADFKQASGELLTADNPSAVNSLQQPDAVKAIALDVHADGPNTWRVELPAHLMATVLLR